MKIQYDIKNITGKNKSVCIGDLIKFYGETRYKTIEGIERLNRDKNTRGMVVRLLQKALNNPGVQGVFDNLSEIAKKRFFQFSVDGKDLLCFDNGKENCILEVEMSEEYFTTKAIYDMMKPGIRKMDFEDYVKKEKEQWNKWFEKNLNEFTRCYERKILEE